MPHSMLRFAAAAALAAGTLAGCSYNERGMPAASADRKLPAVRVTGSAQSCIPLPIMQTVVRDDRTIDFYSGQRRGWRNTLTSDCSGLGSEKAFTYETSLTQLCSSDIIYVLQNWGGEFHRGGSCGLGQFTPVEFLR